MNNNNNNNKTNSFLHACKIQASYKNSVYVESTHYLCERHIFYMHVR